MMSILEYALDVNKDVSLIIDLCKELGIKKQNEEDILTEDDIIMLDNELDSMKEKTGKLFLIYTAFAVIIASVIRFFQYVSVIDYETGFFFYKKKQGV